MFEDHTDHDLEMEKDASEPREMGVEGQDFYYEDLTDAAADNIDSELPAAHTEEAGFYEGIDKSDTLVKDPSLDQSADDLMDA